ncbi:MAG: protease modulator HflC [Planctomycetota bacterium]
MRHGLILLILLALLALVATSVFYTVNEREHAIRMRFGKPGDKPVSPGLHVKWPVVDTIQKYDRRVRVFTTRDITQTLQDKKTIILQAYLCWEIADPLRFYEAVRYERQAKQKINDIAYSALGNMVSQYPMSRLIVVQGEPIIEGTSEAEEPGPDRSGSESDSGQATVLPQIEARMREYMHKRLHTDYGIKVTRFGINRLALPEANEKSVYDRMRKERERAAEKYRAEGRSEAASIVAKAHRAAREIEAKARKESEEIIGEGEAEATRVYQEVYRKDPEFYQFWKTLETYKKIFGSETTLVIPSDSELMKYFRMSGIETPTRKTDRGAEE